jgi:hypothetical protein
MANRPKNLIADHIEVDKKEEITIFRQHIHVTDQDAVPDVVGDLSRYLRRGKATGEFTVRFNQGGCRAIVTEQVTRELVKENKDLTE